MSVGKKDVRLWKPDAKGKFIVSSNGGGKLEFGGVFESVNFA